jgi:hypothetical protein
VYYGRKRISHSAGAMSSRSFALSTRRRPRSLGWPTVQGSNDGRSYGSASYIWLSEMLAPSGGISSSKRTWGRVYEFFHKGTGAPDSTQPT